MRPSPTRSRNSLVCSEYQRYYLRDERAEKLYHRPRYKHSYLMCYPEPHQLETGNRDVLLCPTGEYNRLIHTHAIQIPARCAWSGHPTNNSFHRPLTQIRIRRPGLSIPLRTEPVGRARRADFLQILHLQRVVRSRWRAARLGNTTRPPAHSANAANSILRFRAARHPYQAAAAGPGPPSGRACSTIRTPRPSQPCRRGPDSVPRNAAPSKGVPVPARTNRNGSAKGGHNASCGHSNTARNGHAPVCITSANCAPSSGTATRCMWLLIKQ
jgi:hypothetical protein